MCATQGFDARETQPTAIETDSAKQKTYPKLTLAAQWFTAVFAAAAFGAAAVYAQYASQQVAESQHLAESAADQAKASADANMIPKTP